MATSEDGGGVLSMEYDSNLHSPLPYPCSTLGWGEIYNYGGGVLNAEMSAVMETIQPFFTPFVDTNASTGYLEDALIEWNKFSKRRRLSFQENDQDQSSSSGNNMILDNFNYFSPQTPNTSSRIAGENEKLDVIIPDHESCLSGGGSRDIKQSAYETSSWDLTAVDNDHRHRRGGGGRKKLGNGVVYPFAVVKPGGYEGDITLKDINERIHMPPTRAVKHPVGDFACRPCISPNGPGISGKVVVSFTKIHTQGRGTITIVRTRG